MPIFEFICPKCKEKKELFVPADKKPKCDKCKVFLVKLFSRFGFKIEN